MPIPLIAYLGAAGLGAYLLLRPKPSIKLREAGTVAPPAPILPPPPAGQPVPPGFVQLGSGNLAQDIPMAGQGGFAAASDPGLLGRFMPGDIGLGDCFTINIAAAGLDVNGILSGDTMLKCTDPMTGTKNVKGMVVDPRIPPNTQEIVVPMNVVTGVGPAELCL
jgi:hypothetical protein